MTIKAFPKIFHIGHSSIPHLFDDEVEITEKIDGSQFAFGKLNGELICRSKGVIIPCQPQENDMFRKAWDWVESIGDKVKDNTVIYGEYLQKPHHNTLAYNRVPKNNFCLFGVAHVDADGNYRFNNDGFSLRALAHLLDCDIVPVVYQGKIESRDHLMALLDRESYLGGPKIEGIVVKNYKRDVLVGGWYIPISCGKFVSEQFKEKHQKTWSKEHAPSGKFETLKDNYRTEARWIKAIQHLEERGELENHPRDIGKLMKEVQIDLTEEEKSEIMLDLWKLFGKDVVKHSTRGLPEWYKERLVNNAFTGEEKDGA